VAEAQVERVRRQAAQAAAQMVAQIMVVVILVVEEVVALVKTLAMVAQVYVLSDLFTQPPLLLEITL
jgi:hypothetical protein